MCSPEKPGLCPQGRRDGICRSGCTQSWRSPTQGLERDFCAAPLPTLCPEKGPEATWASWSIFRAKWAHGTCRGTCQPQELPAGPGKAIPRVEAAPKAQDTRHGQPCVTLVVCNHCLTEVASVSPQGICTVVQVGESSCVLGLQAGLGWGKDTRRQKRVFSSPFFFLYYYFLKFVNNLHEKS